MDWRAFWSGLLGSSVPSLAVAAVMLLLNHQMNRAMERYRRSLDRRLQMFSIWHGRRVPALLEIYEAFRKHLDFLRRHLYFTTAGGDMSPYHELRLTLDQQLVFLDDDLAHRIRRLESELLEFWNWALEQRALGSDDLSNVRHRLDFEIPSYLDQLRRLINIYATDGQIGRDGDPQVPNEGMHPTAQRPGGG